MSILVDSEKGLVRITLSEFLEKYKENEHIKVFSREAITLIFEHIEELQEDNPPNDNACRHGYGDVVIYFQDAKFFTYLELVMSLESKWDANASELINEAQHIEGISKRLLKRQKGISPELHFSQIKNQLLANSEYVRNAASVLAFNSGMAFRELNDGWLRLHQA